MRHIDKLNDFLARCEKFLIILLFSALVLLIAFNIISRNLFHVSFQKILEIAPIIVLWLALVGSTLALKHKRHIKLELVLRYFPEKLRFTASIASSAFGGTVMGILFFASLEFVRNEVEIFGRWGWFSIIFPLFFAVSLFRYFALILDNLSHSPDAAKVEDTSDPKHPKGENGV